METKKQRQVAELIKRNFSMVLQAEGSYIYGTQVLVTVTDVKMTPDFNIAKVYFSIFNTENKQEPILEMEVNKHRLQQSLNGRIKNQMRRMPTLMFYLDDTIDEMIRVEEIFTRLYQDNQMGVSDGGEEERKAVK